MDNLTQQPGYSLRIVAIIGLAIGVGAALIILAVKTAMGGGLTYVVVDTGQSKCYDERGEIPCPSAGEAFYGQDGQYNGHAPLYRDNRDGTVTDLNTGLVWQKTPPKDHYSWADALAYAEKLNLAGHDDWRLPTIKELYSLADFRGSMRLRRPFIDTSYFDFYYPDTSQGFRDMDAQYWSSTTYVGRTMRNDISAFGFNVADGRIKSYPTGESGGRMARNYVRCVRGGTEYGRNRYKDLGEGTILDQATGLMWTKDDSRMAMNWKDALAYAENLTDAGHTNWRLPNAKELQSIVDYTRAPDAIDNGRRGPAIDPVFNITISESWFWTSTTFLDGPPRSSQAVYICFGKASAYNRRTGDFSINAHGAGAQRSDPKSGRNEKFPIGRGPQRDQIRINNYVRCVRDAANAD
jgi:hypothetical protein